MLNLRPPLLLLVFLWPLQIAVADCREKSCFVVDFTVESCEYTEINNHDQVEFWTALIPELSDAQRKERISRQKSNISGAIVTLRNPEFKEVPCRIRKNRLYSGNHDPAGLYFIEDSNREVCKEITGRQMKRFTDDLCCDTAPASAECLAPVILREMPEYLTEELCAALCC